MTQRERLVPGVRRALLVACGLSVVVTVPAQDPVLTEFMARNADTFSDGDGEYKDWFEIHNPAASAVNLDGWYVTDDPAEPKKWRFPATVIAAGGYLVVFASYKDRAVSGRELHTNFNLDGDGDDLLLVKPDGVTVASGFRGYPPQRTGYSYGRSGSGLGYFAYPTPWFANSQPVPGFVSPTTIHAERGFHTAPFAVAMSCATPTATIRYTLDGSPPTATTGTVYGSPLRITGTTILRAAAFASGLGPSPIESRTFLFVDDVVLQPDRPAGFPATWPNAFGADYGMDPEITQSPTYRDSVKKGLQSIPTLSVTLPTGDLFGAGGIYANPLSSGPQWEREASAEYFDPATGKGFHTHGGLRIQGGASRLPTKSPKHSLSLRFRDAYRGDLRFPVFPGSRVTRFDSLQIRAVYGNSFIHFSHTERSRAQMIRDQFLRDSLIEMGQEDAGHGRHVCLYLNGLFWGVYVLHERAEAGHFAAWHGGSARDYDARNGTSLVDGTIDAWNAMRAAVTTRNWPEIQKRLDVDNYIDWQIINLYAGNIDLKSNENWRTAGGGVNRVPFRHYSWDAERVLENVNQVGISPSADPPGLLAYLDDIPDFVVRFGDRIHKHFFHGGALSPAQTAARLLRRANDIDTAIVAESARWGDYRRDVHSWSQAPYQLYTRNDHWLPEQRRLIGSYFPQRTANVLAQYSGKGLYPSVSAPVFGQHGGAVPAGYLLAISTAAGSIWFTIDGTDPRAPGGSIGRTAVQYGAPIRIDTITTVKARALSGGKWSALNEARFLIESVKINELLARNDTGIRDNFGEREDWIELYNKAGTAVDLSGMFLADAETAADRFEFPGGTVLQPGATLLVWADDQPEQGPRHAPFKLSATGESVILFDVDGRTVLDRITFGEQLADVSTGRLLDGGQHIVSLLAPTPDQPNELPLCGVRRYTALDPTRQVLDLDVTGMPGIGRTITLNARGGASTGVRAFLVGAAAAEIALPTSPSQLLVALPFVVLGTKTAGPGGAVDLPVGIPAQTALVGKSVYVQTFGLGAGPWQGSGGAEIKVCR